MIGRITGIILEKQTPDLLIDVQGIAYEVSASMTTFFSLPEIGERVTLHTHLSVREDAHQLYGFYSFQEKQLFRMLIKVNGVGPKLALGILSSMEPETFVHAITNHDLTQLTRLPGVGKKTAERLVIEMKDRLGSFNLGELNTHLSQHQSNFVVEPSATQEALSALIALGYKQQEASHMIRKINKPDMSSEELIRLALQSQIKV